MRKLVLSVLTGYLLITGLNIPAYASETPPPDLDAYQDVPDALPPAPSSKEPAEAKKAPALNAEVQDDDKLTKTPALSADVDTGKMQSLMCVYGKTCNVRLQSGTHYPKDYRSYGGLLIEYKDGSTWKTVKTLPAHSVYNAQVMTVQAPDTELNKTFEYRVRLLAGAKKERDWVIPVRIQWSKSDRAQIDHTQTIPRTVAGHTNRFNVRLRLVEGREASLQRLENGAWKTLSTKKYGENIAFDQNLGVDVKAPAQDGQVKYRTVVKSNKFFNEKVQEHTVTNHDPGKYNAEERIAYDTIKSVCGGTYIDNGDPAFQKDYYWAAGLAYTWDNRFSFAPGMDAGMIRWVARHECGHMLQSQTYDNRRETYGFSEGPLTHARTELDRIHPGENGLEKNADCIAVYLGADNWSRFDSECSGAKGQAAYNLISGRTAADPSPSIGAWNRSQYGFATSNAVKTDTGKRQSFQKALAHSSSSGNHVLPYSSPLYSKWKSSEKVIGYPTSGIKEFKYRKGARYQDYEKGMIMHSSQTGAYGLKGGIRKAWKSHGWERSTAGLPTADEKNIQGGTYQKFQGGSYHWSSKTGAHFTKAGGAIQKKWGNLGYEKGILGYPTNEERVLKKNNGSVQSFQGGSVHWSKATGAYATKGAIQKTWGNSGWENGKLGYPTSDERGLKNGGAYQKFQGGSIHWSSKSGAHITTGAIQKAWGKQGYENGRLGYPTSNEYQSGGKTWQNYQGGKISWTSREGARVQYSK